MARKGSSFTAKPRRAARVSSRRASARIGSRFGRKRRSHRSGGGGGKTFMGIDLMQGLVGGAGAVGSGLLTNLVVDRFVPEGPLKTGAGKLMVRGGLTLAAAMIARKALPSKISTPLIVGATIGLGIDTLQTFVMPMLPSSAPLSGYEPADQILGAIEYANPGTLNGLMAIEPSAGDLYGAAY